MSELERPSLLVLVRHAESERNKAKKGSVYFADEYARSLIKGIPDYEIPVTEHGIQQAQQAGVQIRKRFGVFDYVYHSGYRRTIQTTECILGAYSKQEKGMIHVRKNAFIRERDPGYTYDMTREEAEAAFPWIQGHWETFGGFFARPVGGESLAQVSERVYLFLNMTQMERRDRGQFTVTIIKEAAQLRKQ